MPAAATNPAGTESHYLTLFERRFQGENSVPALKRVQTHIIPCK